MLKKKINSNIKKEYDNKIFFIDGAKDIGMDLNNLDNLKKIICVDGTIQEYDQQKRLFRKINPDGIVCYYDFINNKKEIYLPNKDYQFDKYLLQENLPDETKKIYKYHKIQEIFSNGISRNYNYNQDIIQEISHDYISEYNPKTKTIQKIIFPMGEKRKYYGLHSFFIDQDILRDKSVIEYQLHKINQNYFYKLKKEILPDGSIIKYDNYLLPIQIKTKDNIIITSSALESNLELENNLITKIKLPDNSIVEMDFTKDYQITKITNNQGVTKDTKIIYLDNNPLNHIIKIIFPHGYIQEFDKSNGYLIKEIWPNKHIFEYTYLGNTAQLKKEITSTGIEMNYNYNNNHPLALSNIVIAGVVTIPFHLSDNNNN
ncbi:MAG: hypothetical protein Q8875_02480 [Pigeon pea little leaf phytoplasma]|uniref:Uncharacterized protein n=1 Tax=Candidatus Phytoplasma fabacearum TaxID=2982628 RepID=A0ABU8ZTK7_9MOLU|nr:hypothetical protein [Pigeon pea little leaf phytoplasma]